MDGGFVVVIFCSEHWYVISIRSPEPFKSYRALFCTCHHPRRWKLFIFQGERFKKEGTFTKPYLSTTVYWRLKLHALTNIAISFVARLRPCVWIVFSQSSTLTRACYWCGRWSPGCREIPCSGFLLGCFGWTRENGWSRPQCCKWCHFRNDAFFELPIASK